MKKILVLFCIIIYSALAQAKDNEKIATPHNYNYKSVLVNDNFFADNIALENSILKREIARQKKINCGLISTLSASLIVIFTGIVIYFEVLR